MVAQKFVDRLALYHIALCSLFLAHGLLRPELANHLGSKFLHDLEFLFLSKNLLDTLQCLQS